MTGRYPAGSAVWTMAHLLPWNNHAGSSFAQAPDSSGFHSASGSVKKKEPELADTRVPILRLSTLSGGDL